MSSVEESPAQVIMHQLNLHWDAIRALQAKGYCGYSWLGRDESGSQLCACQLTAGHQGGHRDGDLAEPR